MSGPVHFIAQLTIDDADRYRDYEKDFFPILKAHGGKFITYDDDVTLLEGKELGGRTVIIRFESEDACLTWWDSPEYQELAEHRRASSKTAMISIVHALPGR